MDKTLAKFGISKLSLMKIEPTPGVYFLFKDDELVYIGKAVDIYIRIATHRNSSMDFDSAVYYRVYSGCERDLLEIKLIWELRPKNNLCVIDPAVYIENKNRSEKKEPPKRVVEPKAPEKKTKKQPLDPILEEIFSKPNNATSVLSTLLESEEIVIIQRYGLFGCPKKTLRNIGKLIGLTGERVRQIQRKAERKLKHPTRFKKLNDV